MRVVAPNNETSPSAVSSCDAVDVVMQFGAMMIGAGNTATRTREMMDAVARRLGLDGLAVSFSLDSITASVRHSGGWMTVVRETGPPAVNVSQIAELERFIKTLGPEPAPHDIKLKLATIRAAAHQYSVSQIVAAVAMASAGFAFINGAAVPEMMAAAIGGGIGQWLRMRLSRIRLNHYGAVALSAAAASGIFVIVARLAGLAGWEFVHYPAGFIASVLFLVPGFPLIAGLFDLSQYQAVAAVSRFAYGAMLLLSVALGLSFVIAVAGIDITRQPPLELTYALKFLLRGVASFIAGGAFAMVFNTPWRMALAAGCLALVANSLRFILTDMGMMPAPAAFCAALVVGLIAILFDRQLNVPRLALTVAPIVIMIPGISAFEMIVLFNHGRMVEALQASAAFGFVIGALAMGLATARFFRPKNVAPLP